MPLVYAAVGEVNIVKRIDSSPENRQRLDAMGICPGAAITLISSLGGDVIVNVGDCRLAISRALAEIILI